MSVCTHRSKLNNDNKINIKKTAASAKTQYTQVYTTNE